MPTIRTLCPTLTLTAHDGELLLDCRVDGSGWKSFQLKWDGQTLLVTSLDFSGANRPRYTRIDGLHYEGVRLRLPQEDGAE